MFKFHYFEAEIRNAINFAFLLMNENQKNVIILAIMLYELSEKKFFADEKSDEKSSAKRVFEKKSTVEKSKEKSAIDSFTSQFDIVEQIKAAYFDDIILQKIMKSKRSDLKRISTNIIKIEIRLKLENCEIKNELF